MAFLKIGIRKEKTYIDSKVDKVATLKVHVVSNIGVKSIAVKVDIEVEVALACLLARVGSVELRVDDVKVHVITGISEDGLVRKLELF